jgi:hypothetical protein
MRKKDQMYEVEIKSEALLREGKKSLITYFQGGNKKTIVMNCQKLYPQYTKGEDKPSVFITPIAFREYQERAFSGAVKQKGHLMNVEGNVI